MTSEPEQKQAKKRTWFGEWMRSESFWREVATRTLAGIIAGIALALLGIPTLAGLGVIEWGVAGQVLAIIGVWVAAFGIIVILVWLMLSLLVVLAKRTGWKNWLPYVVAVAMLATVVAVMYPLFWAALIVSLTIAP